MLSLSTATLIACFGIALALLINFFPTANNIGRCRGTLKLRTCLLRLYFSLANPCQKMPAFHEACPERDHAFLQSGSCSYKFLRNQGPDIFCR